MVFRNSKYIVIIGSSLMLLLMVALLMTSIFNMLDIRKRLEVITVNHIDRTSILYNMRNIVRERSHSMYAIFLLQDPFAQDEEFLTFNNLASEFIKMRVRLENLGMSEAQTVIFEKAKSLIRESAPLQNSIVDAMMQGFKAERFDAMSAVDLPLEKAILQEFDALVTLEQRDTQNAIASAYEEHAYLFRLTVLLGILVLVLGVIISFFTVRRIGAVEGILYKEKELAEVTLHAIADGMITVDASTNILYLNPRATQLTGWSISEAIGKPLREVYRIYSTPSDTPAEHPVFYQDIAGPVVNLHQYVELHNRHNIRFIVEDSAAPIRNNSGEVIGSVLVFRDVTYEHELSKQLNWHASHDSLTGLINRREFEYDLVRLIASARHRDTTHCCLYVDLDQFKIVNDTCGHIAGDELLKQVATTILSAIRHSDTLARLGGDEFGLLLEGCDTAKAMIIANTILDRIRQFRFSWEQSIFSIGASIGLVSINKDSINAASILSAADAACYMAKDTGRNRICLHQTNDREIIKRQGEMRWITIIDECLEHGRFLLYGQKALPVRDQKLPCYHELLLRMTDAKGKIIDPMSFIPAAERFSIMVKIDRWVIESAFEWLATKSHSAGTEIYAINLSAQSLNDRNFLHFVMDTAASKGLSPSLVCFEITETTAIANWNQAHHFIATLRGIGFRFALDDFGSGMSSFTYLKNFTVDFVKIDGTFVKDIDRDPMHLAIVKSIASVAGVMNVMIIGEWVENEAALEILKHIGIDYAQGFHIHRPENIALIDITNQKKSGT